MRDSRPVKREGRALWQQGQYGKCAEAEGSRASWKTWEKAGRLSHGEPDGRGAGVGGRGACVAAAELETRAGKAEESLVASGV